MPEAADRAARRRSLLQEHWLLILVAVGCGLAGAVGAIFFRSLIHFFTELFFGAGDWFGSPSAALA